MGFKIGVGIALTHGKGVGDPYANMTLISSFPSDISNAYWGKKEGNVTTGFPDPRGGTTAERFLETIVNDTHNVAKEATLDLVSGTTYIMEAVVKPVGGRHLQMEVYDNGFASGYGVNFDLTTGAVGSVTVNFGSIGSAIVPSIAAVGNGYYRCRLRFTAVASFTDANLYWDVQTTSSHTGAYAGDITKGLDYDSLGLYSFF